MMKPIQLSITILLTSLFFFSTYSAKAQVDPSAYANGFMAELIVDGANRVMDIRPAPSGVFTDTMMLKKHFIMSIQVRQEGIVMKPVGRKGPKKLVFGKGVMISKQALRIPPKFWKYARPNFNLKAGPAIYMPRVKGYKVMPAG
ncbi:MAG: hypothetical protein AAFR87_15275 [Bacteroidota bacterium]